MRVPPRPSGARVIRPLPPPLPSAPVTVPDNVAAWTNLADGEDVVAIMGALGSDYAASATGIALTDLRVVNAYRRPDGEPNHHKSYGYLRTPEFSRIAAAYALPGSDPGAAAESGTTAKVEA